MYKSTYQIGGYEPALRPEQQEKRNQGQFAVVDGANFYWHLGSVRSGFGATNPQFKAGDAVVYGMRHPDVHWIGDRSVMLTGNNVREFDGTDWQVVYTFAKIGAKPSQYDLDQYRWSFAWVRDIYFMSHPTIGIVYYDTHTETWGELYDSCWNTAIYGIAASDNRLIVQLEDVIVWSAVIDPTEFHTKWQCGAGSQSLNLARFGQPYGLYEYNSGFLSFTDNGLMVSTISNQQLMHPDGKQLTTGAVVFHHAAHNDNRFPLGPTSIISVDARQVVWLTSQGFYAFQPTTGGGFGGITDWQPVMGRFYRENIVPAVTLRDSELDHFKLSYCKNLNWVTVSSSAGNSLGYSRAHVFQAQLDKWGSYNYTHLSIVDWRPARDEKLWARTFAALARTGYLSAHNPHEAGGGSWIRFSGFELDLPDEQTVDGQIFTTVDEVVFNTSVPDFQLTDKTMVSSWITDERASDTKTRFTARIASSDDQNVSDAGNEETLWPEKRTTERAAFSCWSTGVVHVLTVDALELHDSFDINGLSLSYKFCGTI